MIVLTRVNYLSAIVVSGLIIENAHDVYFERSLKNLGKIHRDHFDMKTIKNVHDNKSVSLNFIVLSVIIDLIIFTARKFVIYVIMSIYKRWELSSLCESKDNSHHKRNTFICIDVFFLAKQEMISFPVLIAEPIIHVTIIL